MTRSKLALMVLVATLSGSGGGCIGRMAVTREVSKFNLEVTKEQWPREITFFVLHVFPAYPLAYLVDLFVVNSIEFWTGTNPVSGEQRLAKVGDTRIARGHDGEYAVSTLREDGSVDVHVYASDGSGHFLNLAQTKNGVAARDASGKWLGEITRDGVVSLADGS